MARKCVFCGVSGGLTAEHVFGDWISRTMNLPPEYELLHEMDGPIRGYRQRRTRKIDIKAKVVCSSCNNGWMSQIESRAKRVLLPLFGGRHTVLDNDDIKAARIWITKTAILTAFVSPGIESVVTRELTKRFYENRESFPCENAWIGLAGQTSPQVIFKVIPKLMNARFDSRGESHVIYHWTAVVGRLAMMSIIFPESMWRYQSELQISAKPYLLSLDSCDTSIAWPPDVAVPDKFTFRWDEA
nr:hypothetical protein [Micromonospora sp. DSM 115978]